MDELHSKYEKLKEYLASLGSVAVAYSAGVDSTFLLKTAHDLLKDKVVAVTAEHGAFPKRERREAEDFCKKEKIEQIKIRFDEMAVEGFSDNPPERCYLCKKALFRKIADEAAARGIACVAEGSNLDDEGDYRPGMKAIAELNIKSPLRAAKLTKREVRALSKERGLYTWDKPSYACLATRIPYGETITPEKILMIERSEQALYYLGFRQSRVRHHGSVARIELEESDLERGMERRAEISKKLKELGFSYVAIDLEGYQTGSLNVFDKKKTI
ncbi:MAG: ATP-dependent sacrificial sulfur transferase LarE [Clostridia bacterium]|nr:ATP-dependent sacrificial sulfur transferase LarE [Clostridia bacterium]